MHQSSITHPRPADKAHEAYDAFIFGAGGHGRVVLDILRAQGGWRSIQFLDGNSKLAGSSINGATVFGDYRSLTSLPKDSFAVVVAIGNPVLRAKFAAIFQQERFPLLNAVHPSAVVTPTATIGAGNMICAQAVINSNAILGKNLIVNTSAVIEHDCDIGDGATISPGCQVGGRVDIGAGAFLGTGVIVLPRLKIGDGAVIGAGSIVTRDVPPRTLSYGSPAKVVENIGDNFDWSRLL